MSCRLPRARLLAGLSLALALAYLAAPDRPALAFPNTQPYAAAQWYLGEDKAWDAWPVRPKLATIKVAVVDSGIDAAAPAFAGQIAAGRSFVGGSWRVDSWGHGTFVAGIIAANPFDGVGIAGIAFNAKLLIAKVVDGSDMIPAGAEARAIRWAANEGARVINLSFGGQRDPDNPEFDFYSASERAAVEYAYAKGAVVVAAVGNATYAPHRPWDFADWPAALPNVLGVSALTRSGAVPLFSNRDPRRVDLAAPGVGIFSTIPRSLELDHQPGCDADPYSNCAPAEFRGGNGTSFAAPQVAAAAALLLGVDPRLSPDQVDWLLERSATGMNPSDGCAICPVGRNALTGWGRLDIARAVDELRGGIALPPPDRLEPDDDTGSQAFILHPPGTLTSSEDYWDDPIDVFAITLRPGTKLVASLRTSSRVPIALRLWVPGTSSLATAGARRLAAAASPASGHTELVYRPRRGGVFYLEVLDEAPSRARAVYRLSIATLRARAR
jgi:thermitase